MKMKVFKRSLLGLMAVLLTFGIGMNVKAAVTEQKAEKTITYDENKYTGVRSNFEYTYKVIPITARLHHVKKSILEEGWNYKRIKEIRHYIDNGVYY